MSTTEEILATWTKEDILKLAHEVQRANAELQVEKERQRIDLQGRNTELVEINRSLQAALREVQAESEMRRELKLAIYDKYKGSLDAANKRIKELEEKLRGR